MIEWKKGKNQRCSGQDNEYSTFRKKITNGILNQEFYII